MKRSARFEQARSHIVAFRDALNEYLGVLDALRDPILGTVHWQPREGYEEQARELRAKVNQISGPAGRASDQLERRLTVMPPPALALPAAQQNPIWAWESVFDASPSAYSFSLSDLENWVDQVIGDLDSQAKEARRQERTLAGLLGRFLAFPSEVREAAGLPAGTVRGRIAAVFAVVVQGLIVTIVGGLLLALLQKLLSL